MMLYAFGVYSQGNALNSVGEVTFVTSNNVYVKFDNTENIQIGDTILQLDSNKPCLVVNNKSSTSLVCIPINNCRSEKGDKMTIKYSIPIVKPSKVVMKELEEDTATYIAEGNTSGYTEDIRGRISASSYNTLFSDREDRSRYMARFSLNANHIKNSKFSFFTYMNYRYSVVPENSIIANNPSYFRVYNLALKYDVNPHLNFTLGRRINPRAWSLGAIDGLQGEWLFGKNYIGGVVGFRPDIYQYDFNSNLFEYSAYFGRVSNSEQLNSDVTIGYVVQKNGNAIDRRYIFFQYSATLFRKLNLFSSLETDIYSRLNGEQTNDPRLTNLYLSAGYRFSRKVDVTVSYDSRKRVIFYETYESEIERMLDDDIARQGIRARINVRPFKYISAGFSYNKRFQSDLDNKADNYYMYASLSKVPGIGGRFMLSYNINNSNYVENKIWSFRYSRTIVKNKLNGELYYRLLNYNYINNSSNFMQNYLGANLSYSITKKLMFSISGEVSAYNQEKNYRIYAKIAQRFYSKKKTNVRTKN
jgi:hypothetical protein